MNRTPTRPAIIIACLIFTGSVFGDEYRTWTDSTGKHKIEATFVKRVGDKIQLKRKDNGKIITLPQNRLSEVDLNYLRQQTKSDKREKDTKKEEAIEPGTKMSFTGSWNNRKYGTKGALHCSAVVKDGKTWTAKFDGDGVYGKFSYEVTISTKKSGNQVQLQGNSTVSGHRYRWTGNVKNGILFGKYTASNGNNGTFRLKQVSE